MKGNRDGGKSMKENRGFKEREEIDEDARREKDPRQRTVELY